MDDPTKPDWPLITAMLAIFAAIMIYAFVITTLQLKTAQKELADTEAMQHQMIAEFYDRWNSCSKMLKDPSICRIMLSQSGGHCAIPHRP